MKRATHTAKKDIVSTFWNEWLEADSLKRRKIVMKLPIERFFSELKGSKRRREFFAGFINSYFEDLEGVILVKLGK